MKSKLILAGIAAVLLTAPLGAQAADLPQPVYKAPAYVAPLFSWNGLYVGVNGGYMWGSSQWSGGAGAFEISPSGWLAGGTVGYNIQTGNWVWGIEGDIDYVDLNGTDSGACGGCTIKDTWLGTARGRVGYAFDHWLLYGTGGAAFGNVYVSTPGGAVSRTKIGWTAGAGVEYAFREHWSAKIEYLYTDFGSQTCDYTTCAIPTDATVDFTANIVRAGLNYRF
jgi:outer membrane immunogenic protein